MAEHDFSVYLPARLSAVEAALAIRSGHLSIVQLAEACLARIAARPDIKAWAYIDRALVLEGARRLDAVPQDKRTPLHGIPVGIKDIFETKGQ
jgi:Asp-tRNA(Asn)/Glu-tRNA(Gln) amidotransferase A subunit family amidase